MLGSGGLGRGRRLTGAVKVTGSVRISDLWGQTLGPCLHRLKPVPPNFYRDCGLWSDFYGLWSVIQEFSVQKAWGRLTIGPQVFNLPYNYWTVIEAWLAVRNSYWWISMAALFSSQRTTRPRATSFRATVLFSCAGQLIESSSRRPGSKY